MTPIEFLKERFKSVNSALSETLRQDYGPGVSAEYYEECETRLAAIGTDIVNVRPSDLQSIAVHLSQLDYVSTWICLIERSQLGAFSWPFAFSLRRVAVKLLSEPNLRGRLQEPLVHIVADGEGYLIDFEDRVPIKNANKKFIIISFPRTLKHYVLLHTIFAHELGHAALFSKTCKATLKDGVIQPFMSTGPLSDERALTAWLRDPGAPAEVKSQLDVYRNETGFDFVFSSEQYNSWIIELFCDLFGLILFGPSFLAAHRALLQTAESNPYECNLSYATHPPYAVRHRMLVEAFKALGWDDPCIQAHETDLHRAEKRFLNYLTNDHFAAWASLIDLPILRSAIESIRKVFAAHRGMAYAVPASVDLKLLIERLIGRLPPVLERLHPDGTPAYEAVHITHTMYAGWIYWLSKDNLTEEPLDFMLLNRLCDQALLHQEAINRVFYPGFIT